MMSLSPDECKWSERLAPGIEVWVHRRSCGCLSKVQMHRPQSRARMCMSLRPPGALTPPRSLQEHTLTPERRLASLWMCIHPTSKIHSFMHLRLDSHWIPADHGAVNHNVAWLSASHLSPSDPPLPSFSIATTTVPALISLLAPMAVERSHMFSPACIMNTHTHTRAHAHSSSNERALWISWRSAAEFLESAGPLP